MLLNYRVNLIRLNLMGSTIQEQSSGRFSQVESGGASGSQTTRFIMSKRLAQSTVRLTGSMVTVISPAVTTFNPASFRFWQLRARSIPHRRLLFLAHLQLITRAR